MSDVARHSGLPFMKMHGLGNDFVVIDARVTARAVTADLARALADRHRGVGFDQLAVIEPDDTADLRLVFYNADGSLSAACGNATRCIARHEMEVRDRSLTIRTDRGILQARDAGGGLTSVNMGQPLTDWADIPLAEAADTLHLPIAGDPVATSMGNPHCTFFVDDAEGLDLAARGAEMEHHPLFPERTNVQFAASSPPTTCACASGNGAPAITLASGSSSCASRRGRRAAGTDRALRALTLDGGEIAVDWRDTGVWMTGPTGPCLFRRPHRRFPRGAVTWTAAPPSSTRSAAASTPTRPRRCGNCPPPPGSRTR
jgi:diaminopimelate epimerase